MIGAQIIGPLLLLLNAPSLAKEVEVVVLSKHRPRLIRIAKGRCAVDGQSVDTLSMQDGLPRACKGDRCVFKETLSLLCSKEATLFVKGLKPRRYGRRFSVRVEEGSLRVVAYVPLERYVSGVVRSELQRAPPEAKKAQAIVARSYAQHARDNPRHKDADLCDLTHCQVFAGVQDEAIAQGLVLEDHAGRVIETFFHSTCGGQTVSATRVWPRLLTTSIVGVLDHDEAGRAWCHKSPHYRWVFEVGAAPLAGALGELTRRKLDARTLTLEPLDPLGLRFSIGDARGTKERAGAALHRALGRRFGWGKLKSSRFQARRMGSAFVLSGKGLGHGVGLCQTGARARAEAGQNAKHILKAYFPKLRLVKR